ncbi:MAG: dihydropteroate synthase [Spirochaetales bacterium]|nr:dihydropteroate synthase [Spirochaetales bacterium]
MKAQLASLFSAVDVRQPLGPLLIGERANATGSKKFRELLLADDFNGMLKVLQSQSGAHVLDVSVAYTGRTEAADMRKIVSLAATGLTQPLMIDSTVPETIEAALKVYPGRPVINSVNFEDGGKTLCRIARLAKTYGAMLVALTIDEKGMALTRERKVAIALRLRAVLVNTFGLRDSDIFFDCLTFTIGSGDESLFSSAVETMEAIKELKRLLPECHTVLGLSNISFGLQPACRHIVNSVFLAQAIQAGLDAAIVDAAKIRPLTEIGDVEKNLALDLIYNRRGDNQRGEGKDPLLAIIRHFEQESRQEGKTLAGHSPCAEEELGEKILKGSREGMEDLLLVLLEKYGAADIINILLIPVMRKIGELFGKGEMLLPFVLQSAETMRGAVNILEPYLPRTGDRARGKVLLATVQGDVHDIGKNLVDIILSNNGYRVFNIGIKQSAENIIAKAREHKADVIGLSGLLVKSALIMKENLNQFMEAGLALPVFLGGAALTRRFVAQECAPLYGGPVVYCKDPFEALHALEDMEQGRLESTRLPDEAPAGNGRVEAAEAAGPAGQAGLDGFCPQLRAPRSGVSLIRDFGMSEVLKNFSKNMLFRARWGFHRKNLDAHEYERLIRDSAEPLFARNFAELEPHLDFSAAMGYFYGYQDGNRLVVENGSELTVFDFPRQNHANGLCIADFFRVPPGGKALVPFFIVTLGRGAQLRVREAFEKDSYKQYLLLHGLAAELTDALAETLHRRIAGELDLAALCETSGTRYGFGYPACPNLDLNRPLFTMLRGAELGLELTENNMIDPEYSTLGIIACHPRARYFSI